MKIQSIILRNFRCFGDSPVRVDLSDAVTALIGANGSGKTAVLMALTRLFGSTQNLRTISRSDFHSPTGAAIDERSSADLAIEVILDFPELSEDEEMNDAVPPSFNHMVVDSPGGAPYCRLRLEASWTNDGTSEGYVEQHLYWVTTGDEHIPDDKKQRVAPHERSLIQVHYVPANRDPAPELRGAARSRVGQLVRAISWDQATRDTVQKDSESISKALSSEQAVGVINRLLQQRWDALRDDQVAAGSSLRFAGSGFEEIIRSFGVVFRTEDDGTEMDLSGLSEGQQSLFYLALVAAVFDVERQVTNPEPVTDDADRDSNLEEQGSEAASDTESFGFRLDQLSIPALTVFEIEEPENHLAPHYLARIVALLRSLTKTEGVQALFSSHSPSVLRRIFPEEIRHLRLDPSTGKTLARKVTLPESTYQESKFVREAVLAYPELYFGKFVVLAEGPSEEVVIPKIASALDLDIDSSFICVVPLGGRHVNHFWKLLTDLDIPFATLLDLDAGRQTGGWARIKYVCDQLQKIGKSPSELLEFEHNGQSYRISEQDLGDLHNKEVSSLSGFGPWIEHLEQFNVFFSAPLDFDLSMLSRFLEAYENTDEQSGPRIPAQGSPTRDQYIRTAIKEVVGDSDPVIETYQNQFEENLFPWYRYLFLSRSKPATHLQALARVEDCELAKHAPCTLKRLLERCEARLATSS